MKLNAKYTGAFLATACLCALSMTANAAALATKVMQNETTTSATTATNTSTTTVGAVGAAPSKIGLAVISENFVGSEAANGRDYTSLMSQNNVDLSYKLAEGKKVDVKQYFLHNMTHTAFENSWGAGDLALQYTDETKTIGVAPTMMRARLYVPVSQASQDVGAYELRLYGTVTQAVGKYVNIEYGVNPRLYTYTVNSDGQKGIRVLPSINVSYAKENAIFAPYVEVDDDHIWGNTGKGFSTSPWHVGEYRRTPVNLDYTWLDIGANFNVSKNFHIQAYYEEGYNQQEADQLTSPEHDLSSYNLNLTVSM